MSKLHSSIAKIAILFMALPVYATDSSSVTYPTNVANQPFLLESGWNDYTATWVITSKRCPSNFYPHVVLTPYKSIQNPLTQQGTALNGVRICPATAYGGTSFYNQGTGYALNTTYSTVLPGGVLNVGFTWAMYCYPGTSWTGATSEYDLSCGLPSAEPFPYSRTYHFIGHPNLAPVYYPAQTGKISWYPALSYPPANYSGAGNNWGIALDVGGSYPYYVTIPYNGTYNVSMSMTIINLGPGDACPTFQMVVNNSFSGPSPYSFKNAVGNWTLFGVKAPSGDPGMGSFSATVNGVHFNAGDVFYISGGVFQGNAFPGPFNCGASPTVIVSSDGSVTVTRTGP